MDVQTVAPGHQEVSSNLQELTVWPSTLFDKPSINDSHNVNEPFKLSSSTTTINSPRRLDYNPSCSSMPRFLPNIVDDVPQPVKNETFTCSLKDFLTDYSPCSVPRADISACQKRINDSVAASNGVGSRLRQDAAVALEAIHTEQQHQLGVIAHWRTVLRAVWDFAQSKKRKACPYVLNFSIAGDLDVELQEHELSASIAERETNGQSGIETVIIPMLFTSATDSYLSRKIRRDIISVCHEVFRVDPRRMFIYAITFENTAASVWYISRTHSVKAQAFDWFYESPENLVSIMLSLAYATSEQLGLDPDIRKSPECHGEFVYIFKRAITGSAAPNADDTALSVSTQQPSEDVFYLTLELLSFHDATNISGRVTRIWKAIEVHSAEDTTPAEGASPVIIKDVWVNVDEPNEGDNMDKLFADVDVFVAQGVQTAVGRFLALNPEHPDDETSRVELVADPATLRQFIETEPRCKGFDEETKDGLTALLTNQKYRSLFLTKLHHHRGKTLDGPSANARHCAHIFQVSTDAAISDCTASCGDPEERGKDVHPGCAAYKAKQQHRFVYEEVCQDMYHLPTVGDVMDVVSQAADALRVMFCAGWLHRDISMGNILARKVEKDSRVRYEVKIADLELSHRMDPQTKSPARVGTPFFMACELMMDEYLLHYHRLVYTVDARMQLDLEDSLASQFGLTPGSLLFDHFKCIEQHKVLRRCTSIPSIFTTDIPPEGARVVPNYQHDLESLWWIATFVVTSLVGHKDSQDYALQIFQRGMTPSLERLVTLSMGYKIGFSNLLHPELRKDVRGLLSNLQRKLHEKYVAMAAFGQLDIHEEYSEVHGHFASEVRKLLRQGGAWQSVPLARPSGEERQPLAQGAQRSKDFFNDSTVDQSQFGALETC